MNKLETSRVIAKSWLPNQGKKAILLERCTDVVQVQNVSKESRINNLEKVRITLDLLLELFCVRALSFKLGRIKTKFGRALSFSNMIGSIALALQCLKKPAWLDRLLKPIIHALTLAN